ncbi:MAG: hypothetical protein WA949_22880, partial [Phormidesmis sp.]
MSRYSIPEPVLIRQVDALKVEIYQSAEAVALAASAKASEILQAAIEKRQQAIAVFATGRSQ